MVHRKKLMIIFQCLTIFVSSLYSPSRYLQLSRFDPCALSFYVTLFGRYTYFVFGVINEYLFLIFVQVDVAIMEVGLGGKYDATNVVCIV